MAQAITTGRTRLGISQAQLAERVGVSQQAVSKWEQGVTDPDLASVIVLARVLGMTVTLHGQERGYALPAQDAGGR